MDAPAAQELDRCKLEAKTTQEFREAIPEIVNQLVGSCQREDCFDHVGPEPIPSRDEVIDIIRRACRLLYPGYFIRKRVDRINLSYYFGQEAMAFFEVLSRQIALAIRHECLRYGLDCTHCESRGQEDAIRFSLSVFNTDKEIDYVIEKFPPIIARLRTLSPDWEVGDAICATAES